MDINGYKLCAYIGYVIPSAHGPYFVVRSSEKISEQFLIGAKVSAHKPIFFATLVDVYDRLDYETHATDKTMRY